MSHQHLSLSGPALGRFHRLLQIGPRGFQGPRVFFFLFFVFFVSYNLASGTGPLQFFFFLFSNLSCNSRIQGPPISLFCIFVTSHIVASVTFTCTALTYPFFLETFAVQGNNVIRSR